MAAINALQVHNVIFVKMASSKMELLANNVLQNVKLVLIVVVV